MSLFVNLTLSNASLVGAKTVKGPAEARVSTKPAALTAASSVVNLKIKNQKGLADARVSTRPAALIAARGVENLKIIKVKVEQKLK